MTEILTKPTEETIGVWGAAKNVFITVGPFSAMLEPRKARELAARLVEAANKATRPLVEEVERVTA